ncbi:MAG: hypothetical protein KBT69_06730 [Oceanihabitans sp.]|nr:hypothetical protein [Oceanihabitans sp.]
MKKLTTILVFLISFYCYSQEYHTIDVVTINKNNYEVKAETKPATFKIQIINNAGQNAQSSINFTYNIDSTIVSNTIITLIKGLDTLPDVYVPSEIEAAKLDVLLEKIKKKKKALRTSTEIIDGEPAQYSGKITLNNKVKLTKGSDKCMNIGQDQENIAKTDDVLNIKKAYINFFNNKASTIVLEGFINGDENEKVTVVNNNFSVPIRFFNNYGSTNRFSTSKNKCYKIDYNDVFSYDSDQHFNYSIANDELHFDKDTLIQPVIQRQFFDFFTAVLYTDVMAFDNNNSNSLVNAQAKLLLPLNQKNSLIKSANYTLFRQVLAEANIALYNGSNDTFRTIEITKNSTENGSFSNFDLLTKNNINGTLHVDVLSHEAKRFFSHISLGYQGTFYRTALNIAEINSGNGDDAKDDASIASLISTSHGPYLNVEIRPQTNFGADVSLSLNKLSYSGANTINAIHIRDTIEDQGVDYFGVEYNIVNIKADFYWLTNPEKGKKGGVFVRLGAFYHTQNYEVYPQLMVGYATNLTSFVNKFSPKTKENK